VPQQIPKFAAGMCAFDRAVAMHHQRAVAVVNVTVAVNTTAHAVVVPATSGAGRYCGRRVTGFPMDLCQPRFFGGLASRPTCADLVGFFFAGPGLSAARRRPPFPVDRRCFAASMLARRADIRSSGTAPGSPC
jgi:hypothetical protein